MSVRPPHYLLFSESRKAEALAETRKAERRTGQWRFVLESLEGAEKVEAEDSEPDAQPDRLELLAVVRGLEALDQPSRVTLVTRSRYVSRGLRFGLNEWRENNWQWEAYGEYTPVNNGDLWRRVDQAMKYHDVQCRTWRFDSSHAPGASNAEANGKELTSEREVSQAKKSFAASRSGSGKVGQIASRLMKRLIPKRRSA